MPSESRGLPFGRGSVATPEWAEERARSLPKADGWIISTQMATNFPEVSSAALGAADTIVFARLPILDRDYSLVKASINVTSGSAGTTASSAIYLHEHESREHTLRRVAGSYVTFSAASTARVTTSCKPITLLAGNRYFIASWASSTLPQFALASGNTATIEATLTHAASTPPDKLGLSQLTKSYTQSTALLVTYFSSEGANFLHS